MNAEVTQFHDASAADLLQEDPQCPCLWDGYLAPGCISLLTSRAKSGKTTLLSLLLKRMEAGGQLAGLAVQPGSAFVVSEEYRRIWRPRHDLLQFGANITFQHRPFGARKPRPAEWHALIDHIADHRARHGTALAVIDSLASFLPAKSEADANCVMEALLPLSRLSEAGLAVLLLHHPRKKSAADGDWARGSSALIGFVDFIIEMHFYAPGRRDDPRRKLIASSRFEATPPRRVIELTPDRTDYRSLGDELEPGQLDGWNTLQTLLAAAACKLTRGELAERWPPDGRQPNDVTLWRWLEQAVSDGLLLKDGAGSKTNPFRYWLPDSIARWEKTGSPEYRLQKGGDEVFQLLTQGCRWPASRET